MDIDVEEPIDISDEEVMDPDEEVTDTAGEAIIEADVKGTTECVHRSYRDKYASKYHWLKELADQRADFPPNLDRVVSKGTVSVCRHPLRVPDDTRAYRTTEMVVAEAFEDNNLHRLLSQPARYPGE